jgi:hypothetical protein
MSLGAGSKYRRESSPQRTMSAVSQTMHQTEKNNKYMNAKQQWIDGLDGANNILEQAMAAPHAPALTIKEFANNAKSSIRNNMSMSQSRSASTEPLPSIWNRKGPTGRVDYSALLEEQTQMMEQQAESRDKYRKLIETFYENEERLARELSAYLLQPSLPPRAITPAHHLDIGRDAAYVDSLTATPAVYEERPGTFGTVSSDGEFHTEPPEDPNALEEPQDVLASSKCTPPPDTPVISVSRWTSSDVATLSALMEQSIYRQLLRWDKADLIHSCTNKTYAWSKQCDALITQGLLLPQLGKLECFLHSLNGTEMKSSMSSQR